MIKDLCYKNAIVYCLELRMNGLRVAMLAPLNEQRHAPGRQHCDSSPVQGTHALSGPLLGTATAWVSYFQIEMPIIIPMGPRIFQSLIRFRARKSAPNLERFGCDVREVMSARMWLAITGNLNAVEASRMVLEKQVAALRAQMACARSLLSGNPTSASRECFDIYQRAVHSNRKRLRKQRRFRGRVPW